MKKILVLLLPFVAVQCFSQDSLWRLAGNAGTTAAHFLGTTDGRPLFFKVNNSLSGWIDNGIGNNTTFGFQAGAAIGAGLQNSLFGFRAGRNLTAGQRNTGAGHSALYTNTTGSYNTATGHSALFSNMVGNWNTANGVNALFSNITGVENTALGGGALRYNTVGVDNTAAGYQALYTNSAGNYNSAYGVNALYNNTAGFNNVAIGHSALFNNVAGINNTATGLSALHHNTSGFQNVAYGYRALYTSTTGFGNVAIGNSVLHNAPAPQYYVAIGDSALFNAPGYGDGMTVIGAKANMQGGYYNTVVGYAALRRGITGENVIMGAWADAENIFGYGNAVYGYEAMRLPVRGERNTVMGTRAFYGNELVWSDANVVMGYRAGTHSADWLDFNTFVGSWTEFQKPGAHDTCRNSTALGNSTIITASNQVRIGNSTVSSIGGFVNWSNISDSRFKKNIRENVPGLDFIVQLKPVTYNLDIEGINAWLGLNENADRPGPDENALQQKQGQLFTGFLAQDVETIAKKINYNFSGIDAPKGDGDLYGLRYAEFVVPLVKAVQEQQEMIKTQNQTIDALKQQNLELQQQLQQIRIKLGMETIITKADK